MTAEEGNKSDLDEIDRKLLSILARDPRIPYSEIADRLEEMGHEMSSEGIRYRVTRLLEITSNFFLLAPERISWELVLVTVHTTDEPGAREDVFEAMQDMNFWFVGSGFGTIDLYGVATAASNAEIDALLQNLRGVDAVDEFGYFIETDRATDINSYLDTGNINQQ